MSKNLFEIADRFQYIAEKILDLDESQVEERDLLLKAMAESEIDIKVKADNICEYLQKLKMEQEHAKSRADYYSSIEKSRKNDIERLKHYVLNVMEGFGMDIVKTDTHILSIKENPEKIEVLDESKIDERFFNVKEVKTLDKKRIKDFIKSGSVVPDGVDIIRGKRIDIK